MGDIQSLKEILIDAARYRWLRENMEYFVNDHVVDWSRYSADINPMLPDSIDNLVGREIDRES